jgi:uncharacterized oligopeptide transporter (OPT) family protein
MKRIGVFIPSPSNGGAGSGLTWSVWKSVVALIGVAVFAVAVVFAITAVLAIVSVASLAIAIWWRFTGKHKWRAAPFSQASRQQDQTQRRGHTLEGQIVPQKDDSH